MSKKKPKPRRSGLSAEERRGIPDAPEMEVLEFLVDVDKIQSLKDIMTQLTHSNISYRITNENLRIFINDDLDIKILAEICVTQELKFEIFVMCNSVDSKDFDYLLRQPGKIILQN